MLKLATLLVLKVLAIDAGCPPRCACTPNAVNCISKNLESVPYLESLTNSPLIIDLSGNPIRIVELADFSFEKSGDVKEIYLNGTELVSIDERALHELENLQELYMADNLLSSLPDDFITPNRNMILLDISRNYFVEMPRIKSESLEVLAIADSQMTEIAQDALDSLPHLRVLLLQQNNLKNLNSALFQPVSNLFFVNLAYNPWRCDCGTIELFNYLRTKKYVDLTEPVQCQAEDRTFVDVYSHRGAARDFKTQCQDGDSELVLRQQLDAVKTVTEGSKPNTPRENVYTIIRNQNDEMYAVVLCISIVVSLIVGASLGSCLTYKYLRGNIKQTESTRQLLTHTINFS